MEYEIIDFHTHPFNDTATNICHHIEYCDMSVENTVTYLKGLGISKICGSVVCRNIEGLSHYENDWDMIADSNNRALELWKKYGDFYVPGFHVHPGYVRESCEEIDRMHNLGVRLIGELVPYLHGWRDYSLKEFDEILDTAAQYNMVVSVHTIDHDQLDAMVKKHPNTVIVAAHPGFGEDYRRQLDRMKMSDNFYLDLSGAGFTRHGMLRQGIDEVGAERFLYGSDFPILNPAMHIGGILLDTLITPEEKQKILADNAKRLLGI